MADRKISELTAITQANLVAGDLIHVVDVSEPDAEKNKKITIAELDSRYMQTVFNPVRTATSFTPSLAAGTATFANAAGLYWSFGNIYTFRGGADVTGAGSSPLTLTLPDSLVIDTNFIARTGAESQNDTIGTFNWFDSGAQYRPGITIYNSTTTVRFISDTSAVVGGVLANNDRISFNFTVAIA